MHCGLWPRPAAVDDDELKGMFSEHGTVNSCVIMRDDEGKSKASSVCACCNTALVTGCRHHRCQLKRSTPWTCPAPCPRLTISTSPPYMTTTIICLCSWQGFGFVNFEAPEQASAAVQSLNGQSCLYVSVRAGRQGACVLFAVVDSCHTTLVHKFCI